MKLIIPMSGVGQRFVDAGYDKLKPLIRVSGKPIIEHVLSMFPGETDIIFICNEEHLRTTALASVLEQLAPTARIVSTAPHKKGPVYAVTQAFDLIADDDSVMVSYCDFFADWDFTAFKNTIATQTYAGAVPCYKDFHPHLLHPHLYAGVLADKNRRLIDIQEKHSFTPQTMDCYQSAGLYYFSQGMEMKRYFQELIDLDINLNGEYYISMVYYLYKRDQKPVFVPEVTGFCQWGTPGDLEEYEAWYRLVAQEMGKETGTTDIPVNREVDVKIPYQIGSPEYTQSHAYWLNFFQRNPNFFKK